MSVPQNTQEPTHTLDIQGNSEVKLQVVTSIYNSMMAITQEIRGTVERTTVLGSSAVLLFDTWIITNQDHINTKSKIFVSLLIAAFVILLNMIIRSLKWRYNNNAQVIRKINDVQMVYEKGAYLANDTLFPEHWQNFGTAKWREPIFRISYISLIVVGILGITALWLL